MHSLFTGSPYLSRSKVWTAPCLRLTLLFFGAAKDVPEAAKTVTAGTANFQMWQLSSRGVASEEMHHQRNQRNDQQDVDQPTGNVEREHSQQPHH
jgi:Sec-independent protein translocase protein TatA